SDIFLVKYNGSGTESWRKQLGSTYTDVVNGVDTDSSGNVYITGYTEGDLSGDNTNDADFFLAKYNSSGTIQWLAQLDTTSDNFAQDIVIDTSNNIYITGYTKGSFDGSSDSGGSDIFLVKYNTSGEKQWSAQTGSSGNEYAKGISVDTSGNIYITGYTSSELDGNSNQGGQDSFVMKFDSSGTKQWTVQTGTTYNDFANSMGIDSENNLFVTGGTDGGLDGNINSGGTDIFLFKLNSTGTKL
ncbi:SBBP repeat-containing protein, partial [Bacteriovoracales bacterium]|nr:SBBP repeat-containing protein [Bacteriovoracales bacterium]